MSYDRCGCDSRSHAHDPRLGSGPSSYEVRRLRSELERLRGPSPPPNPALEAAAAEHLENLQAAWRTCNPFADALSGKPDGSRPEETQAIPEIPTQRGK